MTSSLNAATGLADAKADSPPPPGATSSRDEGVTALSSRLVGEAALRPAPANWRGCGYRRPWATLHGGRAA